MTHNLVAIQLKFNYNHFFSFLDESGKPHSSINSISDIEFTSNGSELWVSCNDSYLIVIDTNDWHIIKNVSPGGFAITQLRMLSTDRIQSVLQKTVTNFSIGEINIPDDKLVFVTESANDGTITVHPFKLWQCSSIKRFICSPDNKLLAVIQCDGTLKLYSMEFLMRQVFQMKFVPQPTEVDQTCSKITENLKAFDKNVSNKNRNFSQ